VALTDPNLHGAVEFFTAAKEAGIKPVIGAEIRVGNVAYCAYVRDRTGYVNLCALMSLPSIRRKGFREHRDGLILRLTGFLPQVRYDSPRDKPMFDILQAIRTLSLVDDETPPSELASFIFLAAMTSRALMLRPPAIRWTSPNNAVSNLNWAACDSRATGQRMAARPGVSCVA
jgi:hypothetical protein